MSCVLSPVVCSTRPTCSPEASRTSQPGSIRNQETGVSSATSDRSAAHVPDGALRPDRLRVRERAQDPQDAGDLRLVQARETAARHLRGGAVAELPRDAEAEAGGAAESG